MRNSEEPRLRDSILPSGPTADARRSMGTVAFVRRKNSAPVCDGLLSNVVKKKRADKRVINGDPEKLKASQVYSN